MTLNQVISSILHFGRSHGQLNTADFRAMADWLDKENIYPAMFFDLARVDKPKNMLSYVFRVHVVDIVTPEKHNEAEVFSDGVLILHDLIAYMAQSDDIHTIAPSGFTPVSEASGDLLTGLYMDLTINIRAPNDTCGIPFKSEPIHNAEHGGTYN